MAELYLVEFKGSRREYFFNTYYHSLKPTDFVIIQAERGEDIGLLSKKITVEMGFDESQRPRSILRRANDEDVSKYDEIKSRETQNKHEIIELIRRHGLVMKVVDVEWQFDGNKMTVFFTADHRVDFRELVKDLASRYKTRIELRQIGVRDEARRIGGIGICGLQQCCNSFIREFKPISTVHAREQDLPLNPSKISGNCGRLLCCLRYEAEMYEAAKSKFPLPGTAVKTKHGNGIVQRVDIFMEEAVIRAEDATVFRAAASDIIETGSVAAARLGATAVVEELREPGLSDEELKRLDDKDVN